MKFKRWDWAGGKGRWHVGSFRRRTIGKGIRGRLGKCCRADGRRGVGSFRKRTIRKGMRERLEKCYGEQRRNWRKIWELVMGLRFSRSSGRHSNRSSLV